MSTIKHPRGVIPKRILLLFDCFGILGTSQGYGQSALSREMNLSPQIIRRRAADARMGRVCRGMPIDQVKDLARIACREIAPLREVKWQELAAWLVGLDELNTMNKLVPAIERWMVKTDIRKAADAAA